MVGLGLIDLLSYSQVDLIVQHGVVDMVMQMILILESITTTAIETKVGVLLTSILIEVVTHTQTVVLEHQYSMTKTIRHIILTLLDILK